MDENEIAEKIGVLVTALTDKGLGNVYDHIPSQPKFPCVIVAPAPEFITEDEENTFTERKINLDVWIVSTPSTDNQSLQKELYKKIAKAITELEQTAFIFDTVGQPQPIEYNQSRCLSSTLTGAFII